MVERPSAGPEMAFSIDSLSSHLEGSAVCGLHFSTIVLLSAPFLALDQTESKAPTLEVLPPSIELSVANGEILLKGTDFEATASKIQLDRKSGRLTLIGAKGKPVRLKREYRPGVVIRRDVDNLGTPYTVEALGRGDTAGQIVINLKDGKILEIHGDLPK